MPAYNSAAYIAESILSVQNQTYKYWELIVVDDGSIDSTVEIVKSIIESDNRIIYLYQKNSKQAAARNNGTRLAKGEWIAFLDSDDIWINTKLQVQYEVIRQHNPDVVYSAGSYLYENGSTEHYTTKTGIFQGVDFFRILYGENHIPILSVVVKKNIIDNIGLQNENRFFQGCEDWDLLLRIAKTNSIFIGLPDQLFFYRKHSQGTSANSIKMRLSQALVLLNNFDLKVFEDRYYFMRLKPLIDSIALTLIQNGKISEAHYLYHQALKHPKKGWFKINLLILNIMGRYSFLSIRIWNKIVSVFLKMSF